MKKDKLMARSIRSFYWSTKFLNIVVCAIHGCTPMSSLSRRATGSDRIKKQNELGSLHVQTTIQQVMEYLEKEYVAMNCDVRFQKKFKFWLDRLMDLGFTHLDSCVFPQKTITFKMLKSLSKEEFLQMDARSLRTISEEMLTLYNMGTESKGTKQFLTVAQLISEGAHPALSKKEINSTLRLLAELGFAEEARKFLLSALANKPETEVYF